MNNLPAVTKPNGFKRKVSQIKETAKMIAAGTVVIAVVAVGLSIYFAGREMFYAMQHKDEVQWLMEGDKYAQEQSASAAALVKEQIHDGVSRAFLPVGQ